MTKCALGQQRENPSKTVVTFSINDLVFAQEWALFFLQALQKYLR